MSGAARAARRARGRGATRSCGRSCARCWTSTPVPVAQVLAGQEKTFGFLVGQAMKKSGGQAVPEVLRRLLREELAARGPRP